MGAKFCLAMGALLLMTPLVSHAEYAVITWDLQGVSFADGATATGNFTFTSVDGTPRAWDITTSGGTTAGFPASITYAAGTTSAGTGTVSFVDDVAFNSSTGLYDGYLQWDFTEVTSGGTANLVLNVAIASSGTSYLSLNTAGSYESFAPLVQTDPTRYITAGTAGVPSAVPLPGGVWLLGAGLGGLGWLRRRAASVARS